jgi:hypothetical protein
LAAVFVADKGRNQEVRQVLTLHRQGKSCEEIASLMTQKNAQPKDPSAWTKYSVATLIHQFTSDRVGIGEADGVDCCRFCTTPVVGPGGICELCQKMVAENASARGALESSGSSGKKVLLFNVVMVVVLIVYVVICIQIVQVKTRHEAAFGEFVLSIIGFIAIVGIWLKINLDFVLSAISAKTMGRGRW